MGTGNPLTGSATRKPASTSCGACGRWHRPGNICPNIKKSAESVPGERAIPGSLHSKDLLNYQASAEPVQDDEQALKDSSTYLKNQKESYLNALRHWQERYGS